MANCRSQQEEILNHFSKQVFSNQLTKPKNLAPDQVLLDESDEYDIADGIHRLRIVQTSQGSKSFRTNSSKDSENYEKTLDVFISYRRFNGSALASLLNVILKSKGYTVFFDVKTLKAGKFDDNLLRSIKEARNFVLVLTPKALDRCIGDYQCKDWIHKEIVAALKFDCNIIPIFDVGFEWPKEEDLPQDMRDVLRYNGLKWDHEFQDAVIEKLQTFIRRETDVNEHARPERNESYFRSPKLQIPRQIPGVPGVMTLEYITDYYKEPTFHMV